MPRRPGGYTTFAIMNFILGGILLLCSVGSGIHPTVTINNQDATHQFIAFLNQQVPGYSVMKIGGAVVGFLLAAGLIVGGVGLLQNQNWGRVLAMVFAIVSLLHHAFLIVFQIFWVNPALDRFFAGFPLFNLSVVPKTLALGFMLFWSLAIIYYFIQILVLAITSPGASRDGDERGRSRRDWDEEDDRPRRRPSRAEQDDDQPRRRRRPVDEDDEDDEDPRPRRRR
jgi:hypothetical protein